MSLDMFPSVVLTARLSALVCSPNSLRALRDVSLASSRDWAVLSRWGRRSVRLKVDHDWRADWRVSLVVEDVDVMMVYVLCIFFFSMVSETVCGYCAALASWILLDFSSDEWRCSI